MRARKSFCASAPTTARSPPGRVGILMAAATIDSPLTPRRSAESFSMSPLSKRFLSLTVGILLLSMTPKLASGAGPASKPDRPSTKKQADAAEIERLIEQLGSNKFAEREAAAKRLEAIGRRRWKDC